MSELVPNPLTSSGQMKKLKRAGELRSTLSPVTDWGWGYTIFLTAIWIVGAGAVDLIFSVSLGAIRDETSAELFFFMATWGLAYILPALLFMGVTVVDQAAKLKTVKAEKALTDRLSYGVAAELTRYKNLEQEQQDRAAGLVESLVSCDRFLQENPDSLKAEGLKLEALKALRAFLQDCEEVAAAKERFEKELLAAQRKAELEGKEDKLPELSVNLQLVAEAREELAVERDSIVSFVAKELGTSKETVRAELTRQPSEWDEEYYDDEYLAF